MKSPDQLSRKFARQWDNADLRESRLLGGPEVWPISEAISRPPPRTFSSDFDLVKRHVERWRAVDVGTVVWETISYRAVAEAVLIPIRWDLSCPSEWMEVGGERSFRDEFRALSAIVERIDPMFHPLLIRRRSLWRGRAISEVIQAGELALALKPGCAVGKPLRTLSIAGIDTKFFERNERLILALLDVRFDGEVSALGLEAFLDAKSDGDHWLLVADLDGSILPFEKMRVPSSGLMDAGASFPNSHARRILIIENETSLHQLPELDGTLAILGAGLNLSWLKAGWLRDKQVGYWGDIDTWGLQFLARARTAVPHLQALLITREIFDAHGPGSAVAEPVTARDEPPEGLSPEEQTLYRHLLSINKGRLEQEFLPDEMVHRCLRSWADS